MNSTSGTRPGGVIQEIDLDSGPPALPAELGRRLVYLLLRHRGRPVGRLILPPGAQLDEEAFRQAVLDAAAAGLAALGHESDERVPAGDVAVVIATRNRPADLAATLARLATITPPPGQVIVADSASVDAAAVAVVAADAGADLLRLEQPGLSRARNAGVAASNRPLVAFLDDDCLVDHGWLAGFRAGFANPSVQAVTGQLLPAELETPAQQLFLSAFHMDRRGFVPRAFDIRSRPSRHWPLDPWRMGSGGNLCVRRESFEAGGGFRTDLGLGTPCRGGEDLFFLWDTIRGGGRVIYRPDAMAWHRHHREMADLRRVMFGYGAGHAAFLRAARRAGAPRSRVALCSLSWLVSRLQRLAGALTGMGSLPAAMVLRELAGGFAGTYLARQSTAAS